MIFFDVYFKVKPEHYKNHKIVLQHDSGDILELTDNINAYHLYSDSEKVIVKVRLQDENLLAFMENIPSEINPFSYEGAAYIGLSEAYIGHTFDEVFLRFPELAIPKQVVQTDAEGDETIIDVPLITDTTIA